MRRKSKRQVGTDINRPGTQEKYELWRFAHCEVKLWVDVDVCTVKIEV